MESNEKLGENVIKVKISGDGAKMTRLTNFIIISFAILNAEGTVMSSKGIPHNFVCLRYIHQNIATCRCKLKNYALILAMSFNYMYSFLCISSFRKSHSCCN